MKKKELCTMKKLLFGLVLILGFGLVACEDDNYFFPETSGPLGISMMKKELEDAGYSFDVLEFDEADPRESQINTEFSLNVEIQTMFVAEGNHFIELINFGEVQDVIDVKTGIDNSTTITWLYFEEGGDTLVITDDQTVIDLLVDAYNDITTTP
jgi:hypothetical protein